MTDHFHVGCWVEYKGGTYRIAAMDTFGFCLLKDRKGELAFIHARSRDFDDSLLAAVEKAVFDNSK